MDINLQELTGIRLDLFVIALAALVVVLIIILIVNSVKMSKLKKNYKIFMEGKDAKSLEDTLIRRLDQIDDLMESDKENKEAIQVVLDHLDATYQKVGLVKYDAFNEMGGKMMDLSLMQCIAERAVTLISKRLSVEIPLFFYLKKKKKHWKKL